MTLAFQNKTTGNDAIFLVEEVRVEMPGDFSQIYEREIWIGRDRVRVDLRTQRKSLVYALDLKTLFVIDHGQKKYYFALTGRDKELIRRPLFGLAPLIEGKLASRNNLVRGTGRTEKIEFWRCNEFEIDFGSDIGIEMKVWASLTPSVINKNDIKKLWFAGAGGSPPTDVRHLLQTLLRGFAGIPIRIITTIEQEGFEVVTTRTLRTIERHSDLPKDFFNIPSDYQVIPRGSFLGEDENN
jgi:hypothetical protein